MDLFAIILCGLTLVANVIVVSFGYGKISQKVENIVKKQSELNGDVDNLNKKMDTAATHMNQICSDVGYLKGRIDAPGR